MATFNRPVYCYGGMLPLETIPPVEAKLANAATKGGECENHESLHYCHHHLWRLMSKGVIAWK